MYKVFFPPPVVQVRQIYYFPLYKLFYLLVLQPLSFFVCVCTWILFVSLINQLLPFSQSVAPTKQKALPPPSAPSQPADWALSLFLSIHTILLLLNEKQGLNVS